jgi:uncharacterized protein (TIGR02271 family)
MHDIDTLLRHRGNNVLGSDGEKIGKLEEIYVDDATGEPEWALVNTGLFGTSSNFVPLEGAQPEGDDLKIAYTKDKVKDAPSVDTDEHLDASEEEELYRYYGRAMSQDKRTEVGTADTGMDTGTPGPGTAETDLQTGSPGPSDTGTSDTSGTSGTVGRDTSGATTDDAMTRSEEELRIDKQQRTTGKARLRKHIVTDHVETTVPVRREEVRVEREPVTDANVDDATDGPALSDEEHEVTLHEEEVTVEKKAVPKERVRLDKEQVTEERHVDEDVRKEEIVLDDEAQQNPNR